MHTTSSLKYHALTLKSHNQYRLDFLPCFPTSFPLQSMKNNNQQQLHSSTVRPKLLLSSVPFQCLSNEQLQRRQVGVYQPAFYYQILGHQPSFLNSTFQYLYQHLSERLHIDPTIIDFNLARLDEAMSTLAMNNDRQYWTKEQQRTREERNIAVDLVQLAIALEIFLQTDVDMLYMKTCCYRGAQPRQMDDNRTEGVFCIYPPEARYDFLPCNREHCRCCFHRCNLTKRPEPAVTFYSSHYHTFLNGYQVILNCPAMCTTNNIIYALTCPCRQMEYIGETKMAFTDRLWRHHTHGTRIMHEFFLGKTIINHTLTEPKSIETLAKDRMRLYRHSAHCSTALQLFLNCNPQYWCFVPMKEMDATNDDLNYAHVCSSTIGHISNILTDEHYLEQQRSSATSTMTSTADTRSNEEAQWMVDNSPVPPLGYRFSQRQRCEQYHYFKHKYDIYTPPSPHLDLYNATIVFVLPNKCSDFVRRFIESLLITHAECQLNTAGRLMSIMETDTNHYSVSHPIVDSAWCENLIHPTATYT